ncbi:redoxin domain-containing protein [Schlesneria paludicola]|uniref:redoxin domain-containing protein n=1 Tax=Schlesneria paludicola TaxID=360056 RepID=UPI00029B3104|nr:redoxin domain-containing protein [Schlesneria paludicola]
MVTSYFKSPMRLWFCQLAMAGMVFGAEVRSELEPRSVPGFQLVDATGHVTEIVPEAKPRLTVVCFLGTECPLARQYGPRLNQLARESTLQDVRFIGVNSNSQDSPAELVAYAKEYGISFPLFKDPANKVADLFGARHMAEVFVLDQTLAIRYHGRVDDQYQPGVMRSMPTRHDLRVALEELLADKAVSVPRTETTGCTIGRVKQAATNSEVTFCKQVSRVLNQHCVECHRPGEIGPFSLTDYNEVLGWGDTILETVDSGRMPPWNADPKFGHFQNARTMPDQDKQLLRDWVNAGMPYGDAVDLPPKEESLSGWQLSRSPDLVLKMRDRPFHVPASGTVEYQYFVVDPQFEEDRWVSAAQVIPGNRSTVHHCIVFVRPPDGSDVRGVGYLTGYVPGQRSFNLLPGHARRVPAGSKFVFQMHYTPNGIEQDDLTQIGMTFIPESQVTHEVFTLLGIDQEFEIPPHNPDYPVHGQIGWFPKKAELLAIIPHMHVRGKAFQAISRQGETTEVLLDVPRYDFNWQHVYEFAKPLPLASIDKLEFTARFDNSKTNPANPDPSQSVTWGDQTWEEMAVAFFEVAEPRTVDAEPEPQRHKQKLIVRTGAEKSESETVEKFVVEFFERFDKNHDGVVERQETPLGFRNFGFHDFDSNRDGKLSREEIEAAAKWRRRKP